MAFCSFRSSSLADSLVRGHHAFQIWIFWVGFLMALLAGAAGLTALTMVFSRTIQMSSMNAWHGWEQVKLSDVIGPLTLSFFATSLMLGLCAGLWLVFTSIYGFIKLASHKPMRQTRA